MRLSELALTGLTVARPAISRHEVMHGRVRRDRREVLIAIGGHELVVDRLDELTQRDFDVSCHGRLPFKVRATVTEQMISIR